MYLKVLWQKETKLGQRFSKFYRVEHNKSTLNGMHRINRPTFKLEYSFFYTFHLPGKTNTK